VRAEWVTVLAGDSRGRGEEKDTKMLSNIARDLLPRLPLPSLLPRPSVLTSIVVGVSVMSGLAFGAAAMGAALVARAAIRGGEG